MLSLFLAAAVADPAIVVTATRAPAPTGISASVIESSRVDALGTASAADLLRLVPGVAVARSGPLGSQTQVRLRGAEANQTLVFIDGIEVNDPAASSEFRFETLGSDGIERIEVLRGPQSALWGSEAIGGVVSVVTRAPGGPSRLFGGIEGGSLGTVRASAGLDLGGIVAQGGYTRSDGIDAVGRGGEKDGYENRFASVKAVVTPAPGGELGFVARYTDSDVNFDGNNPVTFRRDNTLDATAVRSLALRAYGRIDIGDWSQRIEGQYLDTSNRNTRGTTFRNRDTGERFKAGYQSSFMLGAHRLTGAVEHETQTYEAFDRAFGGGSNQRRTRGQTSLVGEYRLATPSLSAGASVRRDANSRFADATTLRADARVALPAGFALRGSYGEGITDPTFTELFGFFPGSFVGNPALTPERAKGFDLGVDYAASSVSVSVGYFDADLTDEIISTFNNTTFRSGVANATGTSKRRGVGAVARWAAADWLAFDASYTRTKSDEQRLAGGLVSKEVRRPKHSGALTATASADRWSLAASGAYVGKRRDTDFDTFRTVTLDDYVLVTLSGRYRLTNALDLTARVENAGDADYQDVVGYANPGIAGYAGVRVRWGG
jgi:vitamin B12 transporter